MEEKKIHILKNVGKLYLKYGIRSVTMDDVAREFGISKKTLYQYFRDKKDLVEQVILYYQENPVFRLNEKNQGNAIDRIFALRTHLVKVIHYYNNNLERDLKKQFPDLYKIFHQFKRQHIYSETRINLENGIFEGLFRDDFDPDFVAKLSVGRMLLTLNPEHEIFSENELSSIELFDKVVDYHMHAICTEKGLEYYRKQLNTVQNEERNSN